MAHRHRDVVSAITNNENMNAKAMKPPAKPLGRRPALDELSNKLPLNKATKKPELFKEVKLITKPAKKISNENEPPKTSSSSHLETTPPTDSNRYDPQMVPEYVTDIYKYLRELETQHPIRENFLEDHQSTPRMRSILVNWLVQVHQNFSLCLETLHLCISIVDRYLQDNNDVGRDTLQLVGTSALLVACKYEEMYMPELSDFMYICDNTFSQKQILAMEMSILMCLECNLGKPSSIHFLRRYSKLANVRFEQHNLSKYILELALLDCSMSLIKPSMQAVAACCLSISILSNAVCPSKVWTEQLASSTEYKYDEFKGVLVKLANILLNADTSKYKAVQGKYADAKYNKISTNPKLKGALVKKVAAFLPKPKPKV